MKKLGLYIALLMSVISLGAKNDKMNVILVMSDDQGYGDLSCNGNPYIQTPNIDKLSEAGYNLRNYHVGTTCAPTRASLMSSMNFNKVGVWHTIMGRSLLDRKYKTMANVFNDNGYATGMFGKWHLGDNYPYRPFDRGFETTLWHKAGGITQISDYWGNVYLNDTYLSGETPVKTEGYCTDVFFAAAKDFIKKSVADKRSFFCYLALNVAHGPTNVEDKYSEPFKGIAGAPSPSFCGMVKNMDDNMGSLDAFLKANGLSENTIVIYTTDNGTSGGYSAPKGGVVKKEISAKAQKRREEKGITPDTTASTGEKGWNAGMQGKKTSNYDGGHRVPFIMYIPDRKGGDVPQLTSCMDVGPSLYELCGIKEDVSKVEGMSFASLLDNPSKPFDRYLVIDTQRSEFMTKGKTYAVLKGNWRYLDGSKLYDITNDVGQRNNIIEQYPEVAKELHAVYEQYWEYIAPENEIMHPIYLASPKDEYVVLSSHDKHFGGLVSQDSLRKGGKPKAEGFWYVKVPEDGIYNFELYRWPVESNVKLKDSAPAIPAVKGFNSPAKPAGVAMKDISGGEILIGDISRQVSISDSENPVAISIEKVKLKKGEYKFFANFSMGAGKKMAASFVKITK